MGISTQMFMFVLMYSPSENLESWSWTGNPLSSSLENFTKMNWIWRLEAKYRYRHGCRSVLRTASGWARSKAVFYTKDAWLSGAPIWAYSGSFSVDYGNRLFIANDENVQFGLFEFVAPPLKLQLFPAPNCYDMFKPPWALPLTSFMPRPWAFLGQDTEGVG